MNAPELPNKDKPKGRFGRKFPVSFVVDQQLEACVQAIKQNSRRSNVQIDLLDEQKDADKVGFSAALFHNGRAITHIWGTLRRWQGTSTRMEGFARNVDHDTTEMILGTFTTIGFLCILSAAPILFFTASTKAERLPSLSPLMPPLLFVVTMTVVMLLGRNYIHKRRLIRRLRKLLLTVS